MSWALVYALAAALSALTGALSGFYASRKAYRDLEVKVDRERLATANLRDEAELMLQGAESRRKRAEGAEQRMERSQRGPAQAQGAAVLYDENVPASQRLQLLRGALAQRDGQSGG